MRSLLPLVWLLALGCTFPMDDKPFTQLSEVPKNDAEIKIQFDDVAIEKYPDIVLMERDLKVSYGIILSGNPQTGGIFRRLGDNLEYLGNTLEGTYTIPKNTIDVGFLEFELIVLVNTGTNSLADKSGREYKISVVKKTLLFANENPNNTLSLQAKPSDGSLLVSWPDVNQSQVKSLTLVRYNVSPNTLSLTSELFTLSPTTTHYIDNSYVGSSVTYMLIVTYNNGVGKVGKYSVIESYIKIKAELKKDGDVVLRWSRSKYFNNTRGYSLYNETSGSNVGSTSNANDTTLTVSNFMRLGQEYNMIVRVQSKTSGDFDSKSAGTAYLGKRISAIGKALYDQAHARYVYVTSKFPQYLKVERQGGVDSIMVDGEPYLQFLSNDGTAVYYINSLAAKNYSHKVDLATLTESSATQLPAGLRVDYILAGNNFVGWTNGNLGFYDLSLVKVDETVLPQPLNSVRRGNASNNFIVDDPGSSVLFLNASNDVVTRVSISQNSGAFVSQDGSQLYLNPAHGQIEVYSFPGLVLNLQQTFSEEGSMKFDPSNDRGIVVPAGIIIDLKTLSVVRTIPTIDRGVQLCGNRLIVTANELYSYVLEVD